jgi:HEPN domain-containing protein
VPCCGYLAKTRRIRRNPGKTIGEENRIYLAGMITATNLRKLARARLSDARALFAARRYDGAAYLSGYVVELALKARICRALRWDGFPETRQEFQSFATFRTHDLNVLLRLSGREKRIIAIHLTEWTRATTWSPDLRDKLPGSAGRVEVDRLLKAASMLLINI